MGNLQHVAIYLAAAVLAVALMKRFGFAAVLGYLLAGIAIGPYGLALIDDPGSARHLAEFGVVLLLFVIGLELQPSRLWALRRPIFGMGSAQVVVCGLVLAGGALWAGLPGPVALVVGFGLAMSSTAFVLQMLAEKAELATQHGRASFAILLFQDLAVIPLIAVLPLLAAAGDAAPAHPLVAGLKFGGVVLGLVVVSRVVLRPLFAAVAATRISELFTATALLVVVATAAVMEAAGLSVTLGAFLAGVLLADSEYRHELEARIAPFEGLLLGLFFISVGMSANLGLVLGQPFTLAGLVLGLMSVKLAAVYAIARGFGQSHRHALHLAAALGQGGEFAFILFGVMRADGVLADGVAELLMLVVTLSMALTPLVYALAARYGREPPGARPFDAVEENGHQVVIAGFGRFGQITARILSALQIPFTALELDPDQVDMGHRFGAKSYYGDASSLELLQAARVDEAKYVVLAIDDPEASVRTAETLRRHFPHVQILARARNRRHVYRLLDLGITDIQRETFHSSLLLTEHLLMGLGLSPRQARRTVTAFRHHDEQALAAAHAIYKDDVQLVQSTREAADELRALFESDTRLRAGRSG